jgi:hypothetical protein
MIVRRRNRTNCGRDKAAACAPTFLRDYDRLKKHETGHDLRIKKQ